MTEADILKIIEQDAWMMEILRTAENQHLTDWVIGAGFVRNKVWDYLHGYNKKGVETHDIDLVYFDPLGNDEEADKQLSLTLLAETGIPWEVVNESYAHKWHNIPPYTSTEDALSQWPETATGIGVKMENGKLFLVAPHGIADLVHLIVRKSPKFPSGIERVEQRMKDKRWLEKWPKLRFMYS